MHRDHRSTDNWISLKRRPVQHASNLRNYCLVFVPIFGYYICERSSDLKDQYNNWLAIDGFIMIEIMNQQQVQKCHLFVDMMHIAITSINSLFKKLSENQWTILKLRTHSTPELWFVTCSKCFHI